jgi:hypothetical protein
MMRIIKPRIKYAQILNIKPLIFLFPFFINHLSYPNGTITYINDSLETFNCDPRGNTTFVVHGWLESIDRPWVRPMINEFLKLRGNCVFFMDYSFYSTGGYFQLTPHFNSIANLLTEKILKIAMPQNVVLFGFSFGARLVTKAGVLIASSEASRVDKIYGKHNKRDFVNFS